MTYAIECRQLTRTWPGNPPVEAVKGIDLQVERGICFGVLGPNGAGKTTTIEICEGLQTATSGEALILGMSWKTNADQIRQQIGISLQETRLSEKLTVLETLTLFRSFFHQGLDPLAVIDRVSLREKMHSRIRTLSGGQKQRVAIARALAMEPQGLLCDEITSALDPELKAEVLATLEQLQEDGMTLVLVTHDEALAAQCDRCLRLQRGHLQD